MITASIFERVCKRMSTVLAHPATDTSKLVSHVLSSGHKELNVPAVAWGRSKEVSARRSYRRVETKRCQKLHVAETGLVISAQYPFIGCSPDGIVSCACHPSRVLEIKCPYTMRNEHPKDAAMAHGCSLINGVWSLDPTSEYYHQVQAQMGIVGMDQCDLVVFTKKGIHTVRVFFKESFFTDMLPTVVRFFKEHVFVSLVQKHIRCEVEV